MVDLNSLIPAGSSLQLTYAVAINDRGEIAGFGVPPDVPPEKYETEGHAYILIPCEENHTVVEGCKDEDQAIAAAIQNSPAAAPAVQIPTSVNHGGLTPQTLASLRVRFARRYRGFGTWPRN